MSNQDNISLAAAICACDAETPMGKFMQKAGFTTALATGALAAAPYILPKIGIGETAAITTLPNLMCGPALPSGLAGTAASIIEQIPLVGESLARGGIIPGITAAGIIMGGKLAGTLIANNDNPKMGKIVKGTSTVIGIGVALPAILPPLKHGAQFALTMAGMHDAAYEIENMIGNTGHPLPYGHGGGFVSLMASHMGCIVSAVAVSLSAIFGIKCKNNVKNLPKVELASWEETITQRATQPQATVLDL